MARAVGKLHAAALVSATSLCLFASSGVALADEPQPGAERIKAAAEEFDRGRRAFLAKDFEQAAGHFENAFRDAPSKETLRLAIRARRDAKQPARAATLAAVAQAQYASDPPTAQLAKETLAEMSRELSEYVIECTTSCTIAADGRVVSQTDGLRHRVFLDPGGHDLGVSFQQGASVTRHVESKKGMSTPLSFEPPPAPVVPAVVPGTTELARPQKPLGPVVFFVAGGVTIVAAAATVISGIATQNDPGPDAVRRDCVGQGEACALYQQGQDAETRTNVLLGVTIGAAVITGVIGLFFTQWSSSGPRSTAGGWGAAPNGRLLVSPGGLIARF